MTTPQDGHEPVSLSKNDDTPDFDPYRFGAPEHPIPPEYAPPGYQPPPHLQYQPPAPFGQAGAPHPQQPQAPQYPQQPYGPQYPQFPAVPPPPPYGQYPQPRTGNGKAIASLVLGIASIVFCWLSILDALFVVLAVIFGLIALNEAKRKPSGEGRGMAISGIACAVVGAILATILTFVIYNKFRDCINLGTGSSAYKQCISNHM
jgi:hypothetical protein